MLRRAIAAGFAAAAFAAFVPQAAYAQDGSPCLGETEAENVEVLPPGPPLGFGINPAGEAGALGPTVPAVPGTKEQDLAALAALRPPSGARFTVRLNRFFWSLGQEGIRRFLALAKRYTNNGYLVELQLRYHPRPDQEGQIDRWLNFVRKVVRRFGPNEGVVALQVTNEVNFYAIAPDASDSYYEGARQALVRGVKTAGRATRRLGYEQLKIGFNWAYRTDPNREQSFWTEIGAGGPKFVAALDWVGLDAYPGTVFPPVEVGDGYRDGIVNAMSVLRDCYLPLAGIPATVPIKVEENGYPTGPGRSEAEQDNAMEQMVRAVSEFRGTFNVTDYRWFDLRDHDTSSANFQHHYGILNDDYTPKPAFETYRSLIADLSG